MQTLTRTEAEELIKTRLDVNALLDAERIENNIVGTTLLLHASQANNIGVAEALCANHADPNKVSTIKQRTPMMVALTVEMLEALKKCGSDIHLKDTWDRTALDWAFAKRKGYDVIKWFLDNEGHKNTNHPIYMAVKHHNSSDVIKLLIQYNFNPLSHPPQYLSPLSLAINYRNQIYDEDPDYIEYLRKRSLNREWARKNIIETISLLILYIKEWRKTH